MPSKLACTYLLKLASTYLLVKAPFLARAQAVSSPAWRFAAGANRRHGSAPGRRSRNRVGERTASRRHDRRDAAGHLSSLPDEGSDVAGSDGLARGASAFDLFHGLWGAGP